MAANDGFPVVRHASSDIAGYPTEILLQLFQDKTVVFVNQGKIGRMLQISPPTSTRRRAAQRRDPFNDSDEQEQQDTTQQDTHESLNGSFLPSPDASSTMTTLFGTSKNEELRQLEQLYASQIAAILFAKAKQPETEDEDGNTHANVLTEAKPVVVALGLKPAFLEGKNAHTGSDDEVDNMQSQRTRFKDVMDLVFNAL